jgi:predicted amidohydrolase YtcJ
MRIGLVAAVAVMSCGTEKPVPASAELVFRGGTVHLEFTADGSRTTDAIAIDGGVVVATGAAALDLVTDATEIVDLDGQHAVPGLQDAHVHLLAGSFVLDRLLLTGVASMDSMADKVAEYAAETPDEAWIVGYGWLNESIDDPNGALIDAVLTDRPALLVNSSGHAAIVNQVALDRAGITADTPDPPGGEIGRDADGAPNGYLLEAAMSLVSETALGDYDDEALSSGLVGALADFRTAGVVGMSEIMAVPGFDIARPWIYADLEEAGALDMRVTWYAPIFELADVTTAAETGAAYDGELTRFGGGKLWVDGSMGTGDSWMSEPLDDDPNDFGSHYFAPDEIDEIVALAEELGLPLKFHVNGDAAVSAALDAFEATAAARGGLSQTHVLDHIVLISSADRARIAELGLVASMQPSHYLPSSFGSTADRWGERFDHAYDFRSMVDAGVVVAMGTDWPVWPAPQPLLTAFAASTAPADRAISVAEALRGSTVGAASAIGRADELGHLDVGALADILVLDRDPLGIDPSELTYVELGAMWIGGRQVR